MTHIVAPESRRGPRPLLPDEQADEIRRERGAGVRGPVLLNQGLISGRGSGSELVGSVHAAGLSLLRSRYNVWVRVDRAQQRRWARQWSEAAVALAEQRARELRELSPEDALRAADALLALGASTPLPERRVRHSGLVAQQALFLRASR